MRYIWQAPGYGSDLRPKHVMHIEAFDRLGNVAGFVEGLNADHRGGLVTS